MVWLVLENTTIYFSTNFIREYYCLQYAPEKSSKLNTTDSSATSPEAKVPGEDVTNTLSDDMLEAI